MRRLAPVAFLLALSFFSALLFAGIRPAGADTNSTSSVSQEPQSARPVADSDGGGGDGGELLYHWQNPRYWRDERRQMADITIVLFAIWLGKRISRRIGPSGAARIASGMGQRLAQ
jgi:hypothetical protein